MHPFLLVSLFGLFSLASPAGLSEGSTAFPRHDRAMLDSGCLPTLVALYPCFQQPVATAECCPALARAVNQLCFCDSSAWGLAGYFGLDDAATRSLYGETCSFPAETFIDERSANCSSVYGFAKTNPVPIDWAAVAESPRLSLATTVAIAVAIAVGVFATLVGLSVLLLLAWGRRRQTHLLTGPPDVEFANLENKLREASGSLPSLAPQAEKESRSNHGRCVLGSVALRRVRPKSGTPSPEPDHPFQEAPAQQRGSSDDRAALAPVSLTAELGPDFEEQYKLPQGEVIPPLFHNSGPLPLPGGLGVQDNLAPLVFRSASLSTLSTAGPQVPPHCPAWLVHYPLEELQTATANFTSKFPLLGLRTMRGRLLGEEVTIERLPPSFSLVGPSGEKATDEDVAAILRPISRIKNAHIQTLKGYCVSDGRCLVVYDFSMGKGADTLANCLFDKEKPVLSWLHRVALAESIALSLLYLHQDLPAPVAAGRIDPKAILILERDQLSESTVPAHLLTGVGLGSLVDFSGALSPSCPTVAGDVHAYGVLLLELLCGASVEGEFLLEVLERAQLLLDGKITAEGLVDPRLGKDVLLSEAVRLITLALKCVQLEPEMRPGMREVVATLQYGMPSLDKVAAIISGFHSHSGALKENSKDQHPAADLHELWARSEDDCSKEDISLPFLALRKSSSKSLHRSVSEANREASAFDSWVNDGQLLLTQIELGEYIGGGAFGSLYHGRWMGTDIAVKIVKGMVTKRGREDLMGVWKEVAILQRLRHPNVVLYMGAVAKPLASEVWIMMEYLVRGSLYSVVHRDKKHLSPLRRLKMAKDVACGMSYLHAQGIVHRDLKSQNLLVTHHATVKVCDFGQSRLRKGSSVHSTVRLAGTAPYMAPELFIEPICSFKCDVYSFGIVLWELVAAKIPWEGLNEAQIMYCVLHDRQRPVLLDDWDPSLRKLISRCWAQLPEDRPTFEEVVQELSGMVNVLERTRREELSRLQALERV